MATTRFPDSSKALTQSTLNDNTLIPCRYKAGTVDDTDKAITFSMMQTTPIAVCTSASGTVNKIASIDNFPDFTLVNGREVVVYFSNGNSAESPSININGTGSILMDGAYWNAGTFMRLKYVDITVSGNRIQKWLVDMGAFNNTTQLNGALANNIITKTYSKSDTYRGREWNAVVNLDNECPAGYVPIFTQRIDNLNFSNRNGELICPFIQNGTKDGVFGTYLYFYNASDNSISSSVLVEAIVRFIKVY